jgi:hypothetical protein
MYASDEELRKQVEAVKEIKATNYVGTRKAKAYLDRYNDSFIQPDKIAASINEDLPQDALCRATPGRVIVVADICDKFIRPNPHVMLFKDDPFVEYALTRGLPLLEWFDNGTLLNAEAALDLSQMGKLVCGGLLDLVFSPRWEDGNHCDRHDGWSEKEYTGMLRRVFQDASTQKVCSDADLVSFMFEYLPQMYKTDKIVRKVGEPIAEHLRQMVRTVNSVEYSDFHGLPAFDERIVTQYRRVFHDRLEATLLTDVVADVVNDRAYTDMRYRRQALVAAAKQCDATSGAEVEEMVNRELRSAQTCLRSTQEVSADCPGLALTSHFIKKVAEYARLVKMLKSDRSWLERFLSH